MRPGPLLHHAFVSAAMLVCAASASERPPNIVIILVDDLGWADLGCQGSRFHETPNIDALAASGVRFSTAYAAGAVSSPSRVALLTGRYPARSGVTDWVRDRFQRDAGPDPDGSSAEYVGGPRERLECPTNPLFMEHAEVTLAELLAEQGYRCAWIGKWNLGGEEWYPESQGFHENIGGCDYDRPPSYLDPYETDRRPRMPTLTPRETGEHLTRREADEAVRFMRRNRARPFLLVLSHYAVHGPLQAEASVVDRYEEKRDAQDSAIEQRNPRYAAMVEGVDDAVGAVVAEIESLGLRESTWICFTSDNGGRRGPTSNAPLRGGKGDPYEGGIRVPLIVSLPGRIPADRIVTDPVCGVDLFPTVAELVGIALPPERAFDGVSLVSLMASDAPQALADRELIWHFPHYRGKVTPYSVLRRGAWKLIKRHEGPSFELFDLVEDPSETRDVASASPQWVDELDSVLGQRLARLEARMPRPNPRFGEPTYSREVHPDNAGKPRVLLIGDSISMGYTPFVRELLHGEAAVFRPMWSADRAENCEGTRKGVATLHHWLVAEGGDWDVIHFNFGLHDLKRVHPVTGDNSTNPDHPYQSDPVAYERQLRAIVDELRQTGAELVFATTTPVPEGVRPYRGVGDPVIYNEIATSVMEEHGVAINDLYAFALPRVGEIQGARDVHFSKAGSRALAEQVVEAVRGAVDRRR